MKMSAAGASMSLLIKFVDQQGKPMTDPRFSNVHWAVIYPGTTWSDVAVQMDNKATRDFVLAWLSFNEKTVYAYGQLQLPPIAPEDYSSISRNGTAQALAHHPDGMEGRARRARFIRSAEVVP